MVLPMYPCTVNQIRCLDLQNSKAKLNNTSKEPSDWLWFKRNPDNPYQVSWPVLHHYSS